MHEAGIKTVAAVEAWLMRIDRDPNTDVVAYYDPRGHATQGKYKTKLKDIYYDNMYCSVFIHTDGPPSHVRIAHIGNRSAAYRMWSDHEWMSNTGNTIEMEFLGVDKYERLLNYPVYAIDFVSGYAVDLNLCPGLGKTPIQDAIPAKEAADAIKD